MNFIHGDAYRAYAQYALSSNGLAINERGKESTYFVKTDQLGQFISGLLPSIRRPFVLISGDSDYPVGQRVNGHFLGPILSNPNLTRWYTANVDFIHYRIMSVPIGLGYSHERPTTGKLIEDLWKANIKKDRLVYASYHVDSNPKARTECLRETKVSFPWTTFENNLAQVARSLFNISPNGSGYDCFRHWESLYLKTIPIVTDDNINIRFYKNFPFLRLKSWSEYKSLSLSQELYESVWGDFDIRNLDLDVYMEKVEKMKHPLCVA
jgi:hypothetical protein